MKIHFNSEKYMIDRVNLKQMRKELLKNNRESAATLIPQDLTKDEDLKSFHDDALLASYTPQDLKIRKALKLKANLEMKKLEAQNKTVYVDQDDDEEEFADAVEEEAKDMELNEEQTQFMVSVANKQTILGRSSLNTDVKLEFMQSLHQSGPRKPAPQKTDSTR